VRKVVGNPEETDALLDDAISENVFVIDDGVLRFTHPLVASAVYGRLAPGRRRALHAQLAAAIEDVEERARHLALATDEPDASVAKALEVAARTAAARGAPDAAATLLEHARRLTPPGATDAIAERLLAEAGYLADACDLGRSREIAGQLLALDVAGPIRARALLLAYLLSPPPNFRDAIDLLKTALHHARRDRCLRARLMAWLASAHEVVDYARAEQYARDAVDLAAELTDPGLEALALSVLLDVTRVRGKPPTRDFDHLLAIDAPQQPGEPAPRVILGRERCSAGELDAARILLEPEAVACKARGAELMRAVILHDLADVEWRAGNWNLAHDHLQEAFDIERDGDNFFGEALTRSAQALLKAHRGDVDEARELAESAIGVGEEWGWEEFVARNRWILGFIELSVGEPHRAWALFEGLPEIFDRIGIREPGHCPFLPDVVETLAALGRHEQAARVLTKLETTAEALQHRWAIPASLRARAMLELAGGGSERALELAAQAAERFAEAGFPFDHGRAMLAAGESLRRSGRRRRAAEKLRAASEIFSDLGARLWHDRAERELRRAAPRPRRSDELTEAERRVTALVGAGRTNREVASELFTTVSTVEAHLTRIYRKLNVRSRTELARRLRELETQHERH
jgi:DNA-binding CsgD family transcriptional regulator